MRRAFTTIVSSTTGRVEELQRLDTAVRTALPLSTRVGFAGVAGGVGCSTAAGLAASVLAARREHRVLAVNASRSPRSLLWHAGLTGPATSTVDQENQRRTARRSDQARTGLALTAGGLHCLDLFTETQPMHDGRWWEAVAPAGRFFDFIVTDWGVRTPATVASAVSASTIICVVTSADRSSLQRGVDLACSIESSCDVGVVLAVTDVQGRRTAAIGDMVRLLPVTAVELGYDRAHGAFRPVASTGLRAATNLAALRLAAALVSAASQGRTPNRGRTP